MQCGRRDSRFVYAMKFFKEFITKPGRVGSVIPSSRELATVVTQAARVPEAQVVVEFGPGTGAITEQILPRLQPGAKFFAMEINPDFVAILNKRFPEVKVYQESATKTPQYLAELGVTHCDSIVSGLPWTVFNDELQNQLLDAIMTSLRPGGTFATYIYIQSPAVPSGKKFLERMKARFNRTGKTSIVWRNVPPAMVVWGEK